MTEEELKNLQKSAKDKMSVDFDIDVWPVLLDKMRKLAKTQKMVLEPMAEEMLRDASRLSAIYGSEVGVVHVLQELGYFETVQ